MLGLDAAGKTSEHQLLPLCDLRALIGNPPPLPAILYKLKLNQSVTTIPTGTFSHVGYFTSPNPLINIHY